MAIDAYSLIRPLAFALDAESAHKTVLKLSSISSTLGILKCMFPKCVLPVEIMGLTFDNPVGLAAGFDKDGNYIQLLSELGFGFIEIGTVTPKAQIGNPKPRLFRLKEFEAVINRMGFNNSGVDALFENVEKRKINTPLGINIGANKDTPSEKRVDDYLICLEKVYPVADYITVNISSPNTPGLRNLQQSEELNPLLKSIRAGWIKLKDMHKKEIPLLVKIAPDLNDDDIRSAAHLFLEHKVSGVIATNTTISREKVSSHPFAKEQGGLSGKPLKERSLQVVRILKDSLRGEIPLIGCGGIVCGEDASDFKHAGANCIQLYSGLVYKGPKLIRECVDSWARD